MALGLHRREACGDQERPHEETEEDAGQHAPRRVQFVRRSVARSVEHSDCPLHAAPNIRRLTEGVHEGRGGATAGLLLRQCGWCVAHQSRARSSVQSFAAATWASWRDKSFARGRSAGSFARQGEHEAIEGLGDRRFAPGRGGRRRSPDMVHEESNWRVGAKDKFPRQVPVGHTAGRVDIGLPLSGAALLSPPADSSPAPVPWRPPPQPVHDPRAHVCQHYRERALNHSIGNELRPDRDDVQREKERG